MTQSLSKMHQHAKFHTSRAYSKGNMAHTSYFHYIGQRSRSEWSNFNSWHIAFPRPINMQSFIPTAHILKEIWIRQSFYHNRGQRSRSEGYNFQSWHIPLPRRISMLSFMPLGHIVKEIWPAQSISIKGVKGQGQSQSDLNFDHDTPSHQDVSTYKIWKL